jgi:hypothetical protein
MFVVVQFPVADGRAFASDAGVVSRPDWGSPRISPALAHRELVRGFGRLAYRRHETSAAWVDEDFFAYAKRVLRFPTLQQRHFTGERGGLWMVRCQFRRLLSDGEATVDKRHLTRRSHSSQKLQLSRGRVSMLTVMPRFAA